jgi:hypothetical protein
MEIKKIITCTGRNGAQISIRPESIVSAAPDEKVIGETIVTIAIGATAAQLYVRMPHSRFVQLWDAALNGRELLVN